MFVSDVKFFAALNNQQLNALNPTGSNSNSSQPAQDMTAIVQQQEALQEEKQRQSQEEGQQQKRQEDSTTKRISGEGGDSELSWRYECRSYNPAIANILHWFHIYTILCILF